MKKLHLSYIALCILLCGFMNTVKAQDPHWSMYRFAPAKLNPAFTGLNDQLWMNINYRSQWASIASPYQTPNISVMMPTINLSNIKTGGFGIHILNDKAADQGAFRSLSVHISYGRKFDLKKGHVIATGLNAGFNQRKIDFTLLRSEDQFSGGILDQSLLLDPGMINNSINNLDLGIGAIWQWSDDKQVRVKTGIAIHHLASTKAQFLTENDRMKSRWTAFSEVLLVSTEDVNVIPHLLYMQQAKAQELIIGTDIDIKLKDYKNEWLADGAVGMDLATRLGDAFILGIHLKHPDFDIGLSYDINYSGLRSAGNGRAGVEFALVLKHPVNRKPKPIIIDTVKIVKEVIVIDSIVEIDTIDYDTIKSLPALFELVIFDEDDSVALNGIVSIVFPSLDSISSLELDSSKKLVVEMPIGEKAKVHIESDGYLFDDYDIPGDELLDGDTFSLEKSLQKVKKGSSITLEDVLFESNSDVLKEQSESPLKNLLKFMNENPDVRIELSGHTDNIGSEITNQDLSKRRAESTRQWLITNGIVASRIESIGYGESLPIQSNDTPEGRSKNRRVEMKVL